MALQGAVAKSEAGVVQKDAPPSGNAAKVDMLKGFKENVIMGHLIPGGTGFPLHRNIRLVPLAVDSLADMLKGIGYVPAGVIELMQRQQQGYAYIRP